MCWNGYPDRPEDERESEWADPDDAQADGWKGEDADPDGEDWKHRYPDEDKAGPEYWLYRGMQDAEDERDAERRRRRKGVEDEGMDDGA
jgi:hypothetical protein